MTTKQATNGASSALAMRQEAAVAPFQPENFNQAADMAGRLARSTLIPAPLRGKPDDVLIILLTGRELGLSVMQSLGGIYVVEGRPSVSAEMLSALVLSHPEIVEAFEPEELTAQRCVWIAQRRGRPPKKFTYTIEDAARAGLTGRDNWKKHPMQMLKARASKLAAQTVFPDLTRNIVLDDEVPEVVAANVPPPAFVPPPEPKREPRPVAATVTATAAPEPEATTTATAEPEDAEIVALPGDEPEQTTTTATDDQPLTDEQKIDGWVQMIERASTLDELRAVGQELAAQEPKGSPVRAACQPAYGKRSAELRRAAQ
jgi:hypothetical protein